MFELACAQSGAKIVYQPNAVSRDSVRVLKIHGSCNFIPDVPLHLMRGIEVEACTVHVEAPIRIASVQEACKHCAVEKAFPPAMALYAPGKEVLYSPAFVLAHQAAWNEAAKHAATIYAIGVRLNTADTHVWDTIANSRATIVYVGGEPEDVRDWARAHRRRNLVVAGPTFAEGLPVVARRLAV
jgi:hypothetical protein